MTQKKTPLSLHSLLVILYFYCFSLSAQEATIDKVEPPSWWTQMKSSHLQLMISGKNLSGYQASSDSKFIKVIGTQSLDNPNYLFIDLQITSRAEPASYRFELTHNSKTKLFFEYQLAARKPNSSSRLGFNPSDVIYLITPDRFVNGDKSNDEVISLAEGVNRQHEGGRYGGDIQGVINSLDYIGDMGFTQIWLNPVLQNAQEKYSYHGYSTTDYYKVDARYGDNLVYQKLSKQARDKGIGLIKDIILNHIGSGHPWMNNLPSKDWINHQAKFNPTTHKREALHDPHGTDEDRKGFADGWFVPTMPDLNQKNPFLATYLIQNSIWWVEFADLSGIRLDTYSYPDKAFLAEYTQRLMQEYPNFNIVGEEWTLNPSIIAYWQKAKIRHDDYQSQLPSLMDFPLQNSLVKGLLEDESWSDGLQKLYATLASDFVYADPYNLVIFPDNHDMSRIHTQLEHNLALTKMAMAFFATTRGIPQFFYGAEVLMANPDSDAHGVIRGEFPGGWSDHKVNAITGVGLTQQQKSMQKYIRKLLNWRKNTSALHQGKLTHYAPRGGVYVYFRHNEKSKVMVVLNKNNKKTYLDPEHYPSMINKAEKAINVLNKTRLGFEDKILLPNRGALILEFE